MVRLQGSESEGVLGRWQDREAGFRGMDRTCTVYRRVLCVWAAAGHGCSEQDLGVGQPAAKQMFRS